MKGILVFAVLMLVTAPLALGQDAMKGDALVEQEKKAWEAWKMNDGEFFKGFLADESLTITPGGMTGKAEFLKGMAESPCEVRSYSLDNFKVMKLGQDARLLVYHAQQDATCDGHVLPPKVMATSVYVKHGEKWMAMLYQETPVN